MLGIFCLAFSLNALADTATVTVHIKSEPLARSLADFAVQAQLSIGDSYIDFGNTVGNPVDGTYAQKEALRKLLAGTGFDFEFLDSSTIIIRTAKVVPPNNFIADPIENVVVTATKRTALAENLPYSIAVIPGAQLESSGMQTAHDMTGEVAGLTTTNLGPGEDKLFVRGLTDSVLPGFSESMVGIYLDEFPISEETPDPNLRLVDIDRVEVLRGPQGSLYGAGSLGGLARIVTRQPVFGQFAALVSSSVATTSDGGISSNLNGMLNIPLTQESMALRLVGYTDNLSGYVDNPRLGKENTNRTTIKGGRAILAWQPDGIWTVTGNVTLQKINSGDSQYYWQSLKPFQRDTYLPEPHTDNFLQAGITVDGAIGSAELVSATGFVYRRLHNQFDATLAWPQLTGFPLGPSPFNFARTLYSYTHETRLTSDSSKSWQWLIGVFLSHRDEDFASSLSGPNAVGLDVLGRSEVREDRANEAAIFGEITYDVTDQISLTGGARAFAASRRVSALLTGLLLSSPTEVKGSNQQTGIAPKLIAQYQPTRNAMFYVQYSQGYRLGGINIDGPVGATHDGGEAGESAFDSDILSNYELGSKIKFFEGLLIWNADIYLVRWKNLQTDQVAPDGAFFVANAGNAHDVGFETDLTAQPIKNLSMQANFFWNNVSLSNINPLLAKSEAILPASPGLSFGVSLRYDIPIDDTLGAFTGIDYSFVGTSHLGFDENASPPMGGYNLTNMRFGLLNGDWQAVLYVNNLMNEKSNTFAFGNPFDINKLLQITPPRPRTIGLTVTWSH